MITVFPHVPKCAGTSILKQLQQTDLNLLSDYEHCPSGEASYQRRCEARNITARQTGYASECVIYGHFPISRYRHLRSRVIAILRHPVDRALSHYCYYKDLVPEANVAHSREPALIRAVRSGSLDFPGFCSAALIRNLYTRYYFPKMTRNDFHYVGFFDDYAASLKDIGALLGVALDDDIWERKNARKEVIDAASLRRAHSILDHEVAWYRSIR